MVARLPFWILLILSTLLWCVTPTAAQMTKTANTGAVSTILINGFEAPEITSPPHIYRPIIAGWTFPIGSTAGIAENATTGFRPATTFGDQVLFIQNIGTATVALTAATAGYWRFSCQTAQRVLAGVTSSQEVEITLDNVVIGRLNPVGSAYELAYTSAVYVSAGTHNLKFTGLKPDNTLFVDELKYEVMRRWNDTATWTDSAVPMTCCMVNIPASAAVVMDGNCDAFTVEISGLLTNAVSTNAVLSAEGVFIRSGGQLIWGTEKEPYLGQGGILLRGTDATTNLMNMGMGAKVLGVMNGGKLSLHGRSQKVWTQLDQTAEKGATNITLKEAVDWKVGDSIVVASTDFNAYQAEKRAVSAISTDKKVLSFTGGLSYMHYGQLQNYTSPSRTFTLDERAEVAVLTRNLYVKGDLDSETNGIGGHIMVMNGGKSYISNVELYRMGQRKMIGRYPFHWHKTGNVAGQYIKNTSIHHSFNRVVTVHSAQNAWIENNVGYDHVGHGFFLEDGDETGCTFKNNLGILTKKPTANEQVRPHDVEPDGLYFKLPATYWITNPKNNFIGNVAAGSEGSGFWMVILDHVMDNDTSAYIPGKQLMGVFDDNRSHSTGFSNFAIDRSVDATTHELKDAFGHYRPFNADGTAFVPKFNRFVSYKARDRGIWIRGNRMEFHDCISADNGRATFFAYNQIMYNSLIVGRSSNNGNPVTATEISENYALPAPASLATGMRGHSIYDGSSGIVNVHFAGFSGKYNYALQTNGAAQKSTSHFASGITFDSAIPENNKADFSPGAVNGYMMGSGLIDEDGSLTGTVGTQIFPRLPLDSTSFNSIVHDTLFNSVGTAVSKPAWKAQLIPSDRHFGLLRMDSPALLRDSMYKTYYAIRSDGYAVADLPTFLWYPQLPVRPNEDSIRYAIQLSETPGEIIPQLRFVNVGDKMFVSILNVPSTLNLSTGSGTNTAVTSMEALNAATQNSYFLKDNTLHLRMVATPAILEDTARFGPDYSGVSNGYAFCMNNGCVSKTVRVPYGTLADFETGIDGRLSLIRTGSLSLPILSSTANGASDDANQFTITSNTDSNNDYVELQINLAAIGFHQIWEQFTSIQAKFDGAPVEFIVYDIYGKSFSLGIYGTGNTVNVDLVKGYFNKNKIRVAKLGLRVWENQMGTLGTSVTKIIRFFDLKLRSDKVIMSTRIVTRDNDGDGKADDWELANKRLPDNPEDMAFHFDTYNESYTSGSNGNFANWQIGGNGHISSHTATNDGKWELSVSNNDPIISNGTFRMDGNRIKKIVIRYKSEIGGAPTLYWATLDSNTYSASRLLNFPNYTANSGYQILEVNVSGRWAGKTITGLRFDPPGSTTTKKVWIDYIAAYGGAGDLDGDGMSDAFEVNNSRKYTDCGDLAFQFNSPSEIYSTSLKSLSGWKIEKDISAMIQSGGTVLLARLNGATPRIINSNFYFSGTRVAELEMRYNSAIVATPKLYWTTRDSSSFSESRSASFSTYGSTGYKALTLNLSTNPQWTDKIITQLRIQFPPDATNLQNVSIDYIKVKTTGPEGLTTGGNERETTNLTAQEEQNRDALSTTAPYMLYPNPFGDELFFAGGQKDSVHATEFHLTDQLGRTIGRWEIPADGASHLLTTAGLPSGIYFMRITQNGRFMGAEKLIKR